MALFRKTKKDIEADASKALKLLNKIFKDATATGANYQGIDADVADAKKRVKDVLLKVLGNIKQKPRVKGAEQ